MLRLVCPAVTDGLSTFRYLDQYMVHQSVVKAAQSGTKNVQPHTF